MQKTISPIAYIENDFKEKFGVPRQSGRAKTIISKISFINQYRTVDALRGIEGFSHLWLLFDFSLVKQDKFTPLVRPPRLGGNRKVGVFASRSPFRPNGLGLSLVKIERVILSGEDAPFILVSGADLIDKTPIFDIKPYLPKTECITDALGGFADEVYEHRLSVEFLNNLDKTLPADKLCGIIECLADDPRPAYQDDQRTYGMAFGDYNIKFHVDGKTLFVESVELV